MTNNAVMKIQDGFEGYEAGVEGDEQEQSGGVIQGIPIKFTNESAWLTRDGAELSADLELVAVNVSRVVQ